MYSTTEPQQAFDRRIDFCNKIHNEAVKVILPPASLALAQLLIRRCCFRR